MARTATAARPTSAAPELDQTRGRHPVLFGMWVTVVVVVALALLLFLVLPTRTWLGQRSGLSDATRRLELIEAENDALASRVAALTDSAEIERLARQQYGMVRPGEQPYSVLPAGPPDQLPASWPYNVLQGILSARAAATGGAGGPALTTTSTLAPLATAVAPAGG